LREPGGTSGTGVEIRDTVSRSLQPMLPPGTPFQAPGHGMPCPDDRIPRSFRCPFAVATTKGVSQCVTRSHATRLWF
jgi:hypothetical protein